MAAEGARGLPNTTYHKVADILRTLSNEGTPTLAALVDAISRQALDSFSYWAPRSESGDRKRQTSASAIRRAIRFAERLGVLTIDGRDGLCRLTPDGQNALRPQRFDSTVADRAQRVLEGHGYSYARISSTVRGLRIPDVPDAKTLYDRRPSAVHDLSEADFRQLITLMANCGAFEMRTSRLFLPT